MSAAKNLDRLFDRVESALADIAMKEPEKIDTLFNARIRENAAYMRTADISKISTGTGKKLSTMQKMDVLLGILRDTDDEEEQFDRELDILSIMSSNGSFAAAVVKIRESLSTLNGRNCIKDRRFRERLNGSDVRTPEDAIELYKPSKLHKVDGAPAYEGMMEDALSIKCDIWEDPLMVKVVGKARKKLNAHVADVTKESSESTTAEDLITEGICKFSMNPDESKEERGLFGLVDKDPEIFTPIWKFLIYTGMLKWRTMFPAEKKDRALIRSTAETAVERVLRACILSKLITEYIADRQNPVPEERIFGNSGTNLSFMYSRVSRFDYAEILMMCFFATAVELEKKDILLKDAELFELREERESVQDGAKELRRLREENESLREKADILAQKAEELGLQTLTEKKYGEQIRVLQAKNKKLNAENLKLERRIAELEKDGGHRVKKKRRKKDIPSAADSDKKDEEKQQPAPSPQEKDDAEADIDGKYLFICQFEPLSQKLRKEFRNSKVDNTYRVTAGNLKSFDACICIRKDCEHPSYYRIKDMCSTVGVPFLHCNTTGIGSIRQFLKMHGYTKKKEGKNDGD